MTEVFFGKETQDEKKSKTQQAEEENKANKQKLSSLVTCTHCGGCGDRSVSDRKAGVFLCYGSGI